MSDVSENTLLQAISVREELFKMFDEMFSSENYHKVLMGYDSEKTYSEVSEEIGVATGTISSAMEELQEFGLIEDTDNGYEKTMEVLDHPIIQYYYWEEVVENEQ